MPNEEKIHEFKKAFYEMGDKIQELISFSKKNEKQKSSYENVSNTNPISK